MFPILCSFYGFFGALPQMENFMYGEEETGDEKVANEVTKDGEASGSKAEPEGDEVLATLERDVALADISDSLFDSLSLTISLCHSQRSDRVGPRLWRGKHWLDGFGFQSCSPRWRTRS
ncbi:hypothetical protein RHMOL_Rhmol11G0011000 [Rhododendron molle]|uniref:Uncharacterized protein n=2 Tax=Rhododendron molle TaxID=49168 RepID=A0ACC0LP31_RHOML|nr:hypothetical protein RHMOL_Rhmol11G0011000 [Rhododendron molle]KAI8529903.1 hypothetical protein RHMOL_Rhmol11G0011000 [Rhododendron molle]